MPPRTSPPQGKPRRPRPGPALPGVWVWLVILAAIVGLFYYSMREPKALEYGDLVTFVTDEHLSPYVKQIELDNEKIVAIVDKQRLKNEVDSLPEKKQKRAREILDRLPTNGRFSVGQTPKEDLTLIDKVYKLFEKRQYTEHPLKLETRKEGFFFSWLGQLFLLLLPVLLLLALFLFLLPRFRDPLGGGFLSNYIKSPARRYERNKMRVTFQDVADMQSAKAELQEVVDFLRTPERFQRLGGQVPKGILLVGPPGTGKTLLARAVAGEANVPFFSISGSEFIQMFVGVGASRVRDMFKTAKENAPCLLFIDEIDAVGRMRGAGVGGGSDEREQTLNQILSEMDGFQPTESVIVIAATNRPDVLDSALLRPGRFDRHVTIDRPNWQGRLEILKVHTRNKPLADDVNLETIARSMIGMTGADLRNLANEAALLATREGKNKIDRTDFSRAADRVLMGPKREEVLTPEAKRRTANHEAGHALVSWLEPEADPPQKVSIIPRGRALGVTFSAPEEERYHHGLNYFKARLVLLMGGRAADRLVYNQAFSGHENDLKEATRLARYMVTHWGMSDRLGPMSFRVGEEHVFLGKEIQEPKDFSEGTAQIIDEEVQKLLREADQRAYELLETHRTELDRLVEALMQREELLREELEEILGPPNKPPSADGRPRENIFSNGSSAAAEMPTAGAARSEEQRVE